MSKETVQFIEMARQAAAAQRQLRLEQKIYDYCETCGGEHAHYVTERGDWEIRACIICGTQKRYRVR